MTPPPSLLESLAITLLEWDEDLDNFHDHLHHLQDWNNRAKADIDSLQQDLDKLRQNYNHILEFQCINKDLEDSLD